MSRRDERGGRGIWAALLAAFGLLVTGVTLRLRRQPAPAVGQVEADPESLGAGHELSDVSVPRMIGLLALLVAAVVLLAVVVSVFLGLLTGRIAPPAAILANPPNAQPPPAPRLETANGQVLEELHAREDQLLNNYTWIDQNAGRVRIPIDRAIEVLSQRGLPVLPPSSVEGLTQGGQAGAGGAAAQYTRPERSSSGRTQEEVMP